MIRVTASTARKNWFQLLDEVVQGEKIIMEHHGRRITVVCEDLEETVSKHEVPDYSALLQVPDADKADQWSWSWSEEDLTL
jgi:hypothetical protein